MTKDKLYSCITATGLIFFMSFGSVFAVASGLELTVEYGDLALGCLLLSVLAAVLYSLPKGGRIAIGLSLAALGLLLLSKGYRAQWLSLSREAMYFYSTGYGFDMPSFFRHIESASHILPLLTVAGIIAVVAAWTILHRYPPALSIFVAVFPLVSCFLVTDTVPSLWALLMLMLGLGLLLMTQNVRIRNPQSGNRLTLLMLVPMVLALTLLAVFLPRKDFTSPLSLSSFQGVFNWMSTKTPFLGQTSDGRLVLNFGGDLAEEVDLSQLGDRHTSYSPVLEVTPSYSGRIYLRVRDYDSYNGKGWESTHRTETFTAPAKRLTGSPRQLQVRVLGNRTQMLLPYYPAEGIPLESGFAATSSDLREYNYEVVLLKSSWENLWRRNYWDTAPTVDERYLALPDHTVASAKKILPQIPDLHSADTVEAANLIARYVQKSAEYSVEVDKMPSDQADFAIWFLESAEKGYCIHFATATTVLLRAHGIPARYVEGYAFEGAAHQQVEVGQNTAHAWVEYYIKNVGWVVLEPTPGYAEEIEEVTTPSTTAPTQSSTTPSEPDVTEPSDPSPTPSTTAPTDPSTKPSKPTDPSMGSTDTTDSGTTLPLASSEDPPAPKEPMPPWLAGILIGLAAVTGSLALLLGQWCLRRWWKLRRLRQGDYGKRVIARYKETKRICRAVKVDMPEELTALAEKAGFSQYAITKEELVAANKLFHQAFRLLYQGRWYQQLFWRFILALY